MKLKEPTKQGQEWTIEPASESLSYSVSPSVSPSPSPEIPGSGIEYIINPSIYPEPYWKYQVVSSGMPYPGFMDRNVKKETDEGSCPFCHQKKDLTKNYCPHCGGSYVA